MSTPLIIGVVIVGAFIFLRFRTGSKANYHSISVDEAREMAKTKGVVFLDVRTPKETAEGKIQNAREADVMNAAFKQKISQMDKDKSYVVYCRSGRRSQLASRIMANAGFGKVYNMKGGYQAWK